MRLTVAGAHEDLNLSSWRQVKLMPGEDWQIEVENDAPIYFRSDQPVQMTANLPTGSIGSEQGFAPHTWMTSMLVLRNARQIVVLNVRDYPIRIYIGV